MVFCPLKKVGSKKIKKAQTDNKDKNPGPQGDLYVLWIPDILSFKKYFITLISKHYDVVLRLRFFIFMSYHFLPNCSRGCRTKQRLWPACRSWVIVPTRCKAFIKYTVPDVRLYTTPCCVCTANDGENRSPTTRTHWTIVSVWLWFYFYSILLTIKHFGINAPIPSLSVRNRHTNLTFRINENTVVGYYYFFLLFKNVYRVHD